MIEAGRRISRQDVARHYDDLDDLYRQIWGEHVHHGFWRTGDESVGDAVLALISEVVQRLDLDSDSHVLDAGCGYGATAAWISQTIGCTVTGVTLSGRQFDFAAHKHAGDDRVRFIHGDILDVRPDSPVDAVIAIESIAHIADKKAFFVWAREGLKAGGRLGVAAWLSAAEPGDSGRRLLLEPICAEGRVPSLCTMGEYQAMALDAGFAIEYAADVSRNVRRTWLLIAMRVARRLLVDPDVRALLTDENFDSRVFARTVFRLLVAYYTGVMRYGILVGRKL